MSAYREKVILKSPRIRSSGGRYLYTPNGVTIVKDVRAGERVVDLEFDGGHSYTMTAETAHNLAVALYGNSENHSVPAPEAIAGPPEPGDLVIWIKNDRQMTGGYDNGTYRIVNTKKILPEGCLLIRHGMGNYYKRGYIVLISQLFIYKKGKKS